MAMLNAKCRRLKILGDTLSEVEIDTMVDTLVERQPRLQIKSLKNTVEEKRRGATRHFGCLATRGEI